MRQAEIAKSAHAQLVDGLVWPSPLGTGLANAKANRDLRDQIVAAGSKKPRRSRREESLRRSTGWAILRG